MDIIEIFTDDELLPQLQKLVDGFPSMRACAETLGVNRTYLYRVLNRQRPVGATLAHVLGYRTVQRYARERQVGRPRKETHNA